MSGEFDTAHTDRPVCPFCGRVEQCHDEIFEGWEEDGEHTCGSCGRDYAISRHISVSYSTRK